MTSRQVASAAATSVFAASRASNRERGATAVEYGLMVCFIAAAIVVAVTTFGSAIAGAFEGFTSKWP